MRLHPLIPVLALTLLAASCSRNEPPPQPQPATRTEPAAAPPATADAVDEPDPVLQALANRDASAPTAAPSPIAPVRPPSDRESERIRSDGIGLAAALACGLMSREHVDGYARNRRGQLLQAGVDAAAYDAAYAAAFDNVQSKYPQADAEVQKQVCAHARTFFRGVNEEERRIAERI